MTNAQTEPTPEHTGPWRVVLVDDHGIFRAGVRHELEQASDKVEIVGEGEDVATSVTATGVEGYTAPRTVRAGVRLTY